MRSSHGDVDRTRCALALAREVEVIAVKRMSFDSVSLTLGFEAADFGIADLGVVLPVASCHAFKHGLVDGEYLLITRRDRHSVSLAQSI